MIDTKEIDFFLFELLNRFTFFLGCLLEFLHIFDMKISCELSRILSILLLLSSHDLFDQSFSCFQGEDINVPPTLILRMDLDSSSIP